LTSPAARTTSAALALVGFVAISILTELPGSKPLPVTMTLEPAEALSSLKEALGTSAWLVGSAVTVAVVEGPAAENSSARAVRPAK
jgi:hypothetical protein